MTKDMTTGAITPLLVKFTIPLVLGNLFQLTYNAADSIIVGKFVGEEALAAVGTSNPLMTLAILFINGMCLGAGILVSTAFGAGDTKLVERQVSPPPLPVRCSHWPSPPPASFWRTLCCGCCRCPPISCPLQRITCASCSRA